MIVNGWRVMWILTSFDMPVKTTTERRRYTIFRNNLLKLNFTQLQFSVYIRHFPTLAAAQAVVARIKSMTPPRGNVICFFITDKQYSMTNMIFGGKERRKMPKKPPQAELF